MVQKFVFNPRRLIEEEKENEIGKLKEEINDFSILSMVTPPVAISSFAAARIAKADPMETSLISAKLALPLVVMPFLFVWF